MPGFIHEPSDTIEDLRRNLRDRYKDGYAVLKELLQNADDAGATQLHIAWVESVPDAEHTLLRGPQLLIVNDGPFTYRDSYAIHLASTGSKGHEAGKIGKFGLGLKSVFHLCEAFFYISDTSGDHEQVADERLKQFGRTGILNPWYGERYADWDDFTPGDNARLRETARSFLRAHSDRWFGLCIPLRKEEHCRQDPDDTPADWAIEPRYCGDPADAGGPEPPEDIFSPRRIASLRQLLPLMSTLERVALWRLGPTDVAPQAVTDVRRTATCHQDWRQMDYGRSGMAGRIEVAGNGSTSCHVYAGAQKLLRHEGLTGLTEQSDWPRTDSQTETGRRRLPAAVKQHAGAVILEQPVEQPGVGSLRVDRAVFLPLGDPPHPECQGTGARDYELMLHGYFFVDAGRLGVDFAPDGEQPTVRQAWNRMLYEEGTLPLVIPALGQYAEILSNQDDADLRLREFTALLTHERCQIWLEYRKQICRDQHWVYRLNRGRGQWSAIEPSVTLALLPGDERTDPALPFAVFPALTESVDDVVYTFDGLPRLTTTNAKGFPSDRVAMMLQSVPLADVMRKEERSAYLCRFCEYLTAKDRAKHLPRLLRRMLEEVPFVDLRNAERDVSALIALLPQGTALPVPFKRDLVRESERVFKTLVEQETDVLPVPDIFIPAQTLGTQPVSTSDARLMLSALAALRPTGAQEDAFYALVSQTLLSVLSAWQPGPQHMLEEFGDLRLFYVRDYTRDARVLLSARDLQASHEQHLVYANSAALCKKLQACLTGSGVIFLAHPEVVQLVAAALGTIPACDAAGCATFLATKPTLHADLPPRVELLRDLLSAWTDESKSDFRTATRYLLHGCPNDTDRGPILYIEEAGPWCTLARCLLNASDQAWRMIHSNLLKDITRTQTRWLHLRRCGPSTVPALLAYTDFSRLDCTPIADRPNWCAQIVREWPSGKEHDLKRLPIYTRVGGGATPIITDQTFVRGNLPHPPESVFPDLVLIDDPTGIICARDLARTLAPESVLLSVLDRPHCHEYWRFILGGIPDQLPDNLRTALRETPWVPGPDGTGCPPASVICRDGLNGHIQHLRTAGCDIVHQDELPQEMRAHPNYQRAVVLTPRGEDLYRRLGEALGGADAYALGTDTVPLDSLDWFIKLFQQDHGGEVMPFAALCQLLREGVAGGTQWIARHLLPAVQRPLPPDRSKDVLNYLAARHETSSGGARRRVLELYNCYLQEAGQHPTFTELLHAIRLLNREQNWCDPASLTTSGQNVSPVNLLDVGQTEAIRQVQTGTTHGAVRQSPTQDNVITGNDYDPGMLTASAALLDNYLVRWRSDEVPDDAIAAVVAMLGDNDGYPELYERLRDARPLAAIRSLFHWEPTGPGWSLSALMGKQHFCLLPADAETVEAVNLLGRPFQASVATRVTSLFDGFDGRTYYSMPNQHRCHVLRLRQIDPEGLSGEDKLAILGDSLLAVRCQIHHQTGDDFLTAWGQVTQVGQLDIEIAQRMILEASALLLETQLSIRQSTTLRDLFNDWHRARQNANSASTDTERRQAEADKVAVLNLLERLLLTDRPIQQLLVGEIRERLDAASYEAASIPFELFQNADDAVVELETLCPNASMLDRARPTDQRRRIMVEVDKVEGDTVLRFLHWGRGINQYRIGPDDGRGRGFDRDMDRMLVLQGSGKEDAETGVTRTGKFGLGFKSVFFVCDTPRILSGSRSRFRVLAGVYPDRLPETDEQRLEKVLDEAGDPSHRGTVIELPLRRPEDAKAALRRFITVAGHLVVFARRIRECCLSGSDHPGVIYRWNPEQIHPGIEAGDILVGQTTQRRALAFRLGADGYSTVLVPLTDGGVCTETLDPTPEIWVTTPTRHARTGALVFNGPFDLNPGRTQLRTTQHNLDVAAEMGQQLGESLCQLYSASLEGWPELRDRMGCPNADHQAFWSSFWQACVPYATAGKTKSVLHRILFGSEHCGMHRLIRETSALPTGLPDRYGKLTSLADVRWRVSGMLAEDKVWSCAVRCEWVTQQIDPGKIIGLNVAQVLDRFCEPELQALTVGTVIESSVDAGLCVEPDTGCSLGQLMSPERLREMRNDRGWRDDVKAMRELLPRLKFKNAAAEWCEAPELLIGHSDEPDRQDETMRARFAPDNRVLAPEYVGESITFFLACRGDMRASAKDMAAWIANASEPQRRRAGLVYLEQGEQSYPVQRELAGVVQDDHDSWLNDKEELANALPGDSDRQAIVMGKLNKGRQYAETLHPATKQTWSNTSTRSPSDILEAIDTWWQASQTEILTQHDRLMYPGGSAPAIDFTASGKQLETDTAVRKQWLILLMRGAMNRIGRVRDAQNRGFLQLCDSMGWLDTLAGPANDPSAWFGVMEAYLDGLQGEAPYYQWMNQFLVYYQLSRWLPNYARAFEAVTRPNVNLADLSSIRDIANLRTSHIFTGSTGFDAPPCGRTLGLGAHFVLRETTRIRASQEDVSYAVATHLESVVFVPSRRVRELLAQILSGGNARDIADSEVLQSNQVPKEEAARTIAEALRRHLGDRSTFNGSFDIPLVALTWSRHQEKQAEVLG